MTNVLQKMRNDRMKLKKGVTIMAQAMINFRMHEELKKVWRKHAKIWN